MAAAGEVLQEEGSRRRRKRVWRAVRALLSAPQGASGPSSPLTGSPQYLRSPFPSIKWGQRISQSGGHVSNTCCLPHSPGAAFLLGLL